LRLLQPGPIRTHPDKYILQLVESRPTSILFNNVELSIYYSVWQFESLNHSFSLTFLIIYSTLTKYLLHNSKAGRNRSFRQKALFNNINLTTWINMSKSLALNCRGRFFHSDKIHTSTILEPGNIYYSCWQSAASHLVNKILHPEKVPTSQVESRPPS